MRKVAPLEPGDAKVRHRWPLQRCILLQGLLVESTGAVGEVMHPLPIQMSIDGGGTTNSVPARLRRRMNARRLRSSISEYRESTHPDCRPGCRRVSPS
jgi:hypothetical protein